MSNLPALSSLWLRSGRLEWQFPFEWGGGNRARLVVDFSTVASAALSQDGRTCVPPCGPGGGPISNSIALSQNTGWGRRLKVWLKQPPTQQVSALSSSSSSLPSSSSSVVLLLLDLLLVLLFVVHVVLLLVLVLLVLVLLFLLIPLRRPCRPHRPCSKNGRSHSMMARITSDCGQSGGAGPPSQQAVHSGGRLRV